MQLNPSTLNTVTKPHTAVEKNPKILHVFITTSVMAPQEPPSTSRSLQQIYLNIFVVTPCSSVCLPSCP